MSAYYFRDGYNLDNPYPTAQGGASVPGFNAVSRGRAQLVNLGWTKPWGVTLVNELHFSYMRDANKIGQPVGGVGPTLASQGFMEGAGTLGIVPLNPSVEGIENVSFNDFTFGVDVTGERQVNNTYQGTESLSKVVGKHTLKFGTDFHLDQVNINSNSINNGAFVFQGTETGWTLRTISSEWPARMSKAMPAAFIFATNIRASSRRTAGRRAATSH